MRLVPSPAAWPAIEQRFANNESSTNPVAATAAALGRSERRPDYDKHLIMYILVDKLYPYIHRGKIRMKLISFVGDFYNRNVG